MTTGRRIKEKDLKLLWGLSAGRCAFPNCNCELIAFAKGEKCPIGEMAHIISHSPNATTRNDEIGGDNTYENLILLCPTHHTLVDKEELKSKFPADLLRLWKYQHEQKISALLDAQRFGSWDEIRFAILKMLKENRTIWEHYGPNSHEAISIPMSNAITIWDLRRIDKIIPNNEKILNIIDNHTHFLPHSLEFLDAIEVFRVHTSSYKKHVYDGPIEGYIRFPTNFEEFFK